MNLRTIALLLLISVFAIVCVQNIEVVQMHFLFWKFEISKLLLLIITLIFGIVAGLILTRFRSKLNESEIKNKG